jgi:hypothetical protein
MIWEKPALAKSVRTFAPIFEPVRKLRFIPADAGTSG